MKRLFGGLVCVAVLGIALSFIGSTSVSAKRAVADKGAGCSVIDPEGQYGYTYDPNCQAHDVLKLDDDGELDFYVYQDHGQTSWRPEETFRSTTENVCYNFTDIGLTVCGVVKESVTPSGEYKSSFKSY